MKKIMTLVAVAMMAVGLHAHFPGPFAKKHFPLGVIASGIYGGVRR